MEGEEIVQVTVPLSSLTGEREQREDGWNLKSWKGGLASGTRKEKHDEALEVPEIGSNGSIFEFLRSGLPFIKALQIETVHILDLQLRYSEQNSQLKHSQFSKNRKKCR